MKGPTFGATGATGKLLTHRCLATDHKVTALVRTPAFFPVADSDRLRVIEGNAFDPAAVRQTVKGADVVLSALGARSLKKEDVLERAVPLIIQVIETEARRVIVALGSGGALPA